MKSPSSSPASSATPLAPPTPPPRITLSRDERALLEEAMEQCRVAADEIQDRLVTLGRWLLQHLFGGDARAALGRNPETPRRVWAELLRRAGGPSLRLNPKLLSTALRIAAWDHQIQDEHWRLLDVGRKELLLPLGEPKLLRDGARHVTAMRLTQRATSAYVQATLESARGEKPAPRLTPARLVGPLKGLRERFAAGPVRRRVRELGAKVEPAQRRAIAAELDQTIALLRELKRDLKR